MDISNINGISTGDIKSFFNNTSLTKTDKTDSFSDVLSAAMGSIGETNDLQNAAEQEEVRFALGESDNTHDLLVAETKAAVALQYTVAVRDKILPISPDEELVLMLLNPALNSWVVMYRFQPSLVRVLHLLYVFLLLLQSFRLSW